MTRILYIAGYGRSGSTILSIILGSHPEITAVGEVISLHKDWSRDDWPCSCGTPYEQCEFWQAFRLNQVASFEEIQATRKLETLWRVPHLLLGLIKDADRQAYESYQSRLFNFVADRSNCQIVVDSTKSAWANAGRFLALSRLAKQDVYVLHVVRNGLAVMESRTVTGHNLALQGYSPDLRFQGVRAALGWTLTNIWTARLGLLLGADHYQLLRYEDFITDPASALQRIGQFCGFDPGILIEHLDSDDYFEVGHLVRGNRIRSQGKIKLRRQMRQTYGQSLKRSHRLLFACVGGWLQRYYGYS